MSRWEIKNKLNGLDKEEQVMFFKGLQKKAKSLEKEVKWSKAGQFSFNTSKIICGLACLGGAALTAISAFVPGLRETGVATLIGSAGGFAMTCFSGIFVDDKFETEYKESAAKEAREDVLAAEQMMNLNKKVGFSGR